ncbi:carboxylesterase 1-like protein [Tanacetum coccineum]
MLSYWSCALLYQFPSMVIVRSIGWLEYGNTQWSPWTTVLHLNTASQATYDDVEEALNWIKSTQDPWLSEYADEFSNCHLMGSSAGANITYHVGLRVSLHFHDLKPLKIKGLILHHLFHGGVERMESEIHLANASTKTG